MLRKLKVNVIPFQATVNSQVKHPFLLGNVMKLHKTICAFLSTLLHVFQCNTCAFGVQDWKSKSDTIKDLISTFGTYSIFLRPVMDQGDQRNKDLLGPLKTGKKDGQHNHLFFMFFWASLLHFWIRYKRQRNFKASHGNIELKGTLNGKK